MKFLKLLFCVLIICFSCSENTEEFETINKEQNKAGRGNFILDPIEVPNNNETEQLMFMTSFLIGKTLIESEEARDYFYSHIANPRITKIELINILDADVIDSNPFEIAFHEQFNTYNWHLNPQSGGPEPPTSTSLDPDPLRWGGILDAQMYYQQYLIEIIELKKWELYFPNKSSVLDNRQTLTEYFQRNTTMVCLWNNNEKKKLFSDGLVLHKNRKGEYLPLNFDPFQSFYFMFILRDKTS